MLDKAALLEGGKMGRQMRQDGADYLSAVELDPLLRGRDPYFNYLVGPSME